MGRTDFNTELLKGVSVLIVDDHPDSREVLRTILRYYGALTADAANAAAAMKHLRRYTPDVIVVDLILPDLTGFELVAQIRQMFGRKVPAVLAFTGHSDVATRRAALAAGCDHYLTKPVDPSVLARSIADLAAGTLWRRKEAQG
jgi:CheY-like chemotaxis protein